MREREKKRRDDKERWDKREREERRNTVVTNGGRVLRIKFDQCGHRDS